MPGLNGEMNTMTEHTTGQLSLTERTISVGGGLVLAAAAAQPRPNIVLSLLALAAGAALAYRGATGYCPVKAALIENRLV